MAIPIINNWINFFEDYDEGLGSSYERIVLNNFLLDVCSKYKINSILEAPCFGFTGVSGINSLILARNGKTVTLLDNSEDRIALMKRVWSEIQQTIAISYSPDFKEIPYSENSFDLSWNFSALWFVSDINTFLSELTRVTSKVIVLTVPNRSGLGYVWQNLSENLEANNFNTEYIKPQVFIPILKNLGWNLIADNYIDSPPWPDIGMKKEALLRKFGIKVKEKPKSSAYSIVEAYKNNYEQFSMQMMKYYSFEKHLPEFLKKGWAHHHYYLFIRES